MKKRRSYTPCPVCEALEERTMLSNIVVLPPHIINPIAKITTPVWTGAPIDHPVLVKGDPGVYTPTSGSLYGPSGVPVYSDVHQGRETGTQLVCPLDKQNPQVLLSLILA
ncbi:MAG TPA: hypothetical protein VJY33_04325 [Isosphaeraceae bacterium]|nr:hypothetical protein [Isosphaeraceae bacterium]